MADKRWTPKKVRAMRRELIKGGKTLQEIGEREGVSRERIRQVVGNTGRKPSLKGLSTQERITKLVRAGLSDAEIATRIGQSVGSVKKHRQNAGIKRPNPWYRHTIESSIRYARLWYGDYGYSPAVADWSIGHAPGTTLGKTERDRRLREFSQKYGKPPTQATVHRLFGSWPELIRQANLPPVPQGYQALSRFDSKKNDPTGES